MIYNHTVLPPPGFHFCNPYGSKPLNLSGYAALFQVLYCTSEGEPAGTVAIWSYVAPELCNTTSFHELSAHGNAFKHTILIIYNGVGTITTQSGAFSILSNKRTIAGPNWFQYHDYHGDVSYAYSGINPAIGPYTFY